MIFVTTGFDGSLDFEFHEGQDLASRLQLPRATTDLEASVLRRPNKIHRQIPQATINLITS